ncbi:xylulose-5-phosphate/fructose-6-phosphate phosphoketolase [Paramicrobacterium humi]|uniref:Xylulose-5-phosphate/fructose-6-phosphate phosphoketolase n=1 Tax=Paramicrobacterium humi TaxID=640635 RepID=A0A1H4NGH1_9MICO|nr:phosphoketolase family protein [Microbacterium humi]SEB94005.1 xylulose-5-phosphate/fructose-6-phosphate phosphoketolase [Microbacterium humi]
MAPPVSLDTVHAWWRAANYLSAGQIYLTQDPLLRTELTRDDIKPRLLGHWGTTPGLNLVYAHLNRIIVERGTSMIFVCGPGHGGPAMVANAWLDGTYSELFPDVGQDVEGLTKLVRQFSFPGGIPSHAAPETPGSINEGGELGYSLMHAYGAALDNPDLVVACVIGDGEAETGPLAASWRAHAFLNPKTDGAVLPILHLNGYKIANPTLLARIPDEELAEFFRGHGYEPLFVTGDIDDPEGVHGAMAETMDAAFDRIREIQASARSGSDNSGDSPRWPAIIMRTPKGWTGPREVDGVQVEGTYRAHQVPLAGVRDNDKHREQLEQWLHSYRPDELFTLEGAPVDDLLPLRPSPKLRMSASDHAQGGIRAPLMLPDIEPFAVDVFDTGAHTDAKASTEGEGTADTPENRKDGQPSRTATAESTKVFAAWLAETMSQNRDSFRLFGPDEVESNRLTAVFDVTNRVWREEIIDLDTHLAGGGQVIEALSEHLMQGLLEGYLLTGRHGLLTSYEAFIHIVDSMFNQHAKWIESADKVSWRRPIASLNYLLSSHVWRQDHNGFSHQDPGFLNVVVSKQADVVRVYLPPDANTLLATMQHVFDTQNRVNVVVAGKQPEPAWLTLDEAKQHVKAGLGVWPWAGNERDFDSSDPGKSTPDVVIACAGDVPTTEAIAAAQLVREELLDVTVRLVNIVDLMRLQDARRHPHGLEEDEFDAIFTADRPVIFAFHGYPSLIHQLTYKRTNHANVHVHGFMERGTTTTPFDMVHLNDLDRYALAIDVVNRVPGLSDQDAAVQCVDRWQRARVEAREYAYTNGEDPAFITDWEFHR